MYYLQGDIITGGTIYKDMFVEIRDKKITFVGRAQEAIIFRFIRSRALFVQVL